MIVGTGGGGVGWAGGVVGVLAATCFLQPVNAMDTTNNKAHIIRTQLRFLISASFWRLIVGMHSYAVCTSFRYSFGSVAVVLIGRLTTKVAPL